MMAHHPTDPVEMRRINFQTPGMQRATCKFFIQWLYGRIYSILRSLHTYIVTAVRQRHRNAKQCETERCGFHDLCLLFCCFLFPLEVHFTPTRKQKLFTWIITYTSYSPHSTDTEVVLQIFIYKSWWHYAAVLHTADSYSSTSFASQPARTWQLWSGMAAAQVADPAFVTDESLECDRIRSSSLAHLPHAEQQTAHQSSQGRAACRSLSFLI